MGTYIESSIEIYLDGKGWVAVHEPTYSEQCYVAFAVLANVRNYHGVKPIASRYRWLPLDVTALTREKLSDDELGEFSWVSLAELDAYDWEAPVGPDARIPDARIPGVRVKDVAGALYSSLLPALRKLCAQKCGGRTNYVRLVFGFD